MRTNRDLHARKRRNTAAEKILAAILLSVATGAFANTTQWMQTHLPSPTLVGEGTMRWFGLEIYSARLWADTSGWQADRPFALEISYARAISRERLVSTSVEEIRRVCAAPDQHERDAVLDALPRWESAMRNIFVNVQPGDSLLGIHSPETGASFFTEKGFLGQINEPRFSQCFFGIWLDPRTRAPELRQQLLAEKS